MYLEGAQARDRLIRLHVISLLRRELLNYTSGNVCASKEYLVLSILLLFVFSHKPAT